MYILYILYIVWSHGDYTYTMVIGCIQIGLPMSFQIPNGDTNQAAQQWARTPCNLSLPGPFLQR